MGFVLEDQGIFFLRLALACVCGGIIGIERQQRIKVAGVRTHLMIALAAALMMIISKYGFCDVIGAKGISWDVSRIAAGIITGVGILGGGLIFTGKQGSVSGITTAAGVWVTIGIGMALGAGMYTIGVGTTVIVVTLQLILHKKLWLTKQAHLAHFTLKISEDKQEYEKVMNELEKHNFQLKQIKWERIGEHDAYVRYQVIIPERYTREEIMFLFMQIPQVDNFNYI